MGKNHGRKKAPWKKFKSGTEKETGYKKAEVAERWEDGCGQGSGTTSPAQGGMELSEAEAAIGQDHSARGGIAGCAGEGGEQDGERKQVGHGAVRAQN
jgi:hypothetical protein